MKIQQVMFVAALAAVSPNALSAASTDKCLLDWVETEALPEEQSAAAGGAPVAAAAPSAQACGYSTSFYNTYNHARNSLTIQAGGRTFRFMPLALYHKPSASHCDRIKIRNACYEILEPPDGPAGRNLSIRLFDKDIRSKGSAIFTILSDGRLVTTSDGRATEIHREFALIRNGNARSSIGERIQAFKDKAQSCHGGGGESKRCLSGLEAAAENLALERIRTERLPGLSEEKVRDDRAEMGRAVGGLGNESMAIHDMMLRNELGPKKSPYELSDAGSANSGLTFGVRQLDIGSDNEDAESIFSRNLAEFAAAPAWARYGAHKRFIYGQSFRTPVRKYTVEQLAMLHQAVPILDNSMRTPAAKRRYNAHHRVFLDEEVRRYVSLRRQCLFKDSPYLALAAVDRHNQLKEFYDTVIRKVSAHCRKRSTVADAEADVARSFTRYDYRSKNIWDIVREYALR
jgi:hypothetical protein